MSVTKILHDPHVAAPAELAGVTTALADAFFDDRIFRWITPDDEQRRTAVDEFFPLAVEAFAPHGAVYGAADGAGAALWLPPGRELLPEDQAEEFGRRAVEAAGGPDDAARMAALLELLEAHHPHEPCWYLNFLAVRPDHQGRGIGAALLTAVLAAADRDGVPAYLEATSPDNQRLYGRHGFRTVRELVVADSPALYAMWREPA